MLLMILRSDSRIIHRSIQRRRFAWPAWLPRKPASESACPRNLVLPAVPPTLLPLGTTTTCRPPSNYCSLFHHSIPQPGRLKSLYHIRPPSTIYSALLSILYISRSLGYTKHLFKDHFNVPNFWGNMVFRSKIDVMLAIQKSTHKTATDHCQKSQARVINVCGLASAIQSLSSILHSPPFVDGLRPLRFVSGSQPHPPQAGKSILHPPPSIVYRLLSTLDSLITCPPYSLKSPWYVHRPWSMLHSRYPSCTFLPLGY